MSTMDVFRPNHPRPRPCQAAASTRPGRWALVLLTFSLGFGALPASARQVGYLEVLSAVAAGDDGVVRLLELERARAESARDLEVLEREQTRAIRRLEPAGALLPVGVLHLEAYRAYVEAGEPFPAVRSRRLLELVIERLERAGEPRAAAALLASAGYAAVRGQAAKVGQRAWEKALELDPGSPPARLGLALLYERQGRFADAAIVAGGARGAGELDAEAALRRGVNLVRAGDVAGGLPALRVLAGSADTPAWVRDLAFQESARALAAAEGWSAARDWLEVGFRELPESTEVAVLLAHAADRARDPSTARWALENAAPRPAPAPRDLYNKPSDLAERLAGAELARAAEAGREALALAVARLEERR